MNVSSETVKWNQGFTGCGDHSCIVKKPIGQGTNGGCRCPAQVLKVIIRRLQSRLATCDFIDIVFEHIQCRPDEEYTDKDHPGMDVFVEVENPEGKSISIGEWIEREDGYWVLRIPRDDPGMDEDQEKRLESLEKEVGRIEHDLEHGPSETPSKH